MTEKRARLADISKWQIGFTFLGNLDGIIVKVTEGWDVDPCYMTFLPEVMKVPIRGAYHYFRTETDPVRQAENFLLQTLKGDFHFLAVDYESKHNTLDRAGAESLLVMLEYLREAQDLEVFIYTGPYIYRDNLQVWNDKFDDFPLWLARHNPAITDPTVGIIDGKEWDIWQWTSSGDGSQFGADSINIDLNVYNGTVKQLRDRFKKESNEMDTKKWYASKTIWFAVLFALVQVAGIFGYADYTPGTVVAEYIQLGVAVVTAILRAVTTKPVEL